MATLNGVHYSNTSGLNLKTNGTTQVNISTGGVIEFNQAYTFPTSDGSANNVLLTNGSGSLSFGTVPNAGLTNSSLTVTAGSGLANGGSVSLGGSVTINVGAGTGIVVNTNDVALDYAGTNNFIDSATNLEGTSIATSDTIVYHDATDNNVKKGFVSDLPFSNNSGTVTSVAISGSDGIDVDSGSPITTSGTIALGLSNIPNSSLANSSVTVGSTAISLGGSATTLTGLASVTSTAFVGDLTGDVNGNASTADTWANSRTLTLGTDLSGNVSFNGSANFTLNASIVSGAVGSTELDTNAVTTTKITDGNVTNAKLANSSFTVNAPSGSDPVVPLGGTLNFTSSDSSVTIAGNSGTDTIDLTVAAGVDTFVTGGTFTSGTLSLSLNDGTSAQDISGLWTSIPNSALANSAITIAGTSVSLGGSISGDDIISDVSAGQITNSQLANSSLTVTAGSGLANGGSVSLGGSVTLNVGAGTGIQVNANDVALDYAGTNNFIDSATNLEGTGIATSDTIVYHDATDNNVKKGLVSDLPFSNNSGTVTSVGITAGALIDVSNSPITTSGNITVAVDLSELSTSTTNGDGDFFAVVDASNVQRKLTKGNINISGFNNDAGFTTNTGTVTSVAISGTDGIDVDSGSPITGSGTIQLGLSNVPNSSLANSSITINGTAVSLGGTISVGDITEVIAGDGLTGGGNSGSVTIDVDYAGTDNYILAAGAGTGDIQTAWHIPVSNASNNVLYYDVLALPFTNNQGTVTSVAISGTDGIDVDSGSPITGSGTIQLGLSNVPNSSLANSSVTVTGGNGLTGGGSVSLGGSVTLNVGAGTLIDVDGSNVNVDLSELTTSTANGDGDYFVVVDTANAQKKLTKGNINISGFNNDAGYITSAGNTNIYNINGTLSGARELNQNGNNLRFRGTSNEEFQVYKSNATAVQTPRVRFETDDTHTSVLELQASAPTTFLIDAYDAGNAPVFNVDGVGNLFAVSKSFLIEHPSKEGFNLRHGSLEGPEHGVYVRGKLDGSSTIELPDYWLDLVDENTITVQLTPIGSHQNLYVKDIIDNTVIVANSALLSSKIKCFYFVQAERKDIDKMVVEYPRETPTI